MHIHSAATSSAGNSLAGAALAAETALATRRAQELREAGRKLKALSLDVAVHFADQMQGDPQSSAESNVQTTAQAVTPVGAWASSSSAANAASAQVGAESFAQRFTADLQLQQAPAQLQPIEPVSGSAPVSFWA